jgi:hypothetical protein
MIVLGEKLGGGPTNHSAGLGVVLGALFLGSSRVRPTLIMAYERLSRMWTATERVHGAYVDWCKKCTCHVYRVFPYKMYINLNHRDSRI